MAALILTNRLFFANEGIHGVFDLKGLIPVVAHIETNGLRHADLKDLVFAPTKKTAPI